MTIKIYVNDTRKDGTPYVDKNGKPYSRASIKLEDGSYASKNLYTKEDIARANALKDFDQIEVTENGEFKNWDFVDLTYKLKLEIESLKIRVSNLEGKTVKDIATEKRDDIDVSSLPF